MFRRLGLALVLCLSAMSMGFARAQSDSALERAVAWLRAQQQDDGGFGGPFGPGSDTGITADAILALASAGVDPSDVRVGETSAINYLADHPVDPVTAGWGLLAKVVLAVRAAGLDPRAFQQVDLVAQLEEAYQPGAGFQGQGPFDYSLIVLALANAGQPLPDGALETLLSYRLEDGSFSFTGDLTPGMGDSNTTAMVVQALVAAGAADEIGPSIDYFRATQNEDSGWTYQKPSAYGEDTDANSTALVIQALEAAGEDLQSWNDPLQALRAFQLGSGAFYFSASYTDENMLATLQAIPALGAVDYTEIAAVGESIAASSQEGPTSTLVALATLGVLAIVLVVALVVVRRKG